MAFLQRPRGAPSEAPGQSQINRPKTRLPEGYTPNSTLPPGYLPPVRDLQRTGAMLRSSRKTVLSRNQIIGLAFGAGAIVIAVAVVVTFLVGTLFVQSTLNSPETSIDTFYSALRSQDYATAYAQLSSNQKNVQSEAVFASHYQQLDVLGGPVVDFTIDQTNTSGTQATATVQVNRASTQNQITVDTLSLVQNNGTWYINQIGSRTVAVTATPRSISQPAQYLMQRRCAGGDRWE